MKVSTIEAIAVFNELKEYTQHEEELAVFDKAIEALKKQDPKLVVKEMTPWKTYEFKCPNCGIEFIDGGWRYCPDCGQKLSWEE